MATPATRAEQRTSRRFALKLPVSIRCENGHMQEVPAETRDVSAQGVFFYPGSSLAEGTKVNAKQSAASEVASVLVSR